MHPSTEPAAGPNASCCRAPRCWLSLKIRSQVLLLYGLIALLTYGCMIAIAAGGIFAVRYQLGERLETCLHSQLCTIADVTCRSRATDTPWKLSCEF